MLAGGTFNRARGNLWGRGRVQGKSGRQTLVFIRDDQTTGQGGMSILGEKVFMQVFLKMRPNRPLFKKEERGGDLFLGTRFVDPPKKGAGIAEGEKRVGHNLCLTTTLHI